MTAATEAAGRGELADAWRALLPHRAAVTRDAAFARLWLLLWRDDPDAPAEARAFEEILATWPEDQRLAALVVDGYLKSDEVAAAVELSSRTLSQNADPTAAARFAASAAAAFRLAGRDDDALAAMDRADRLDPSRPLHFERGLLHKARGKFHLALAAFQAAHASDPREATLWNIAIAATICREGRVALQAWQELGFEAVLGADSLPAVTGLGRAKVRIPATQPGIFEDCSVQMRSPCHGVVLTPGSRALAADYSDLVAWDGAPLGVLAEGEQKIPLFPYLARLIEGGAKKYHFRATESGGDHLAALGKSLPDAVWLHLSAGTSTIEGWMIVEPELSFEEARAELTSALANLPGLKVELDP